ncbi:P63C domain-containing protein [Lyngbya sp. CCY1209]|uniref:P63C domain-containing protein n=1 Tax=Lyngbya sp. CCY1209 TaxID=2886103 RepID=UPI002D20CACB|nr:P63C domain-containing protein [Lyngbya sp. CCY1209]MEB3885962.1 P63C domain-containing protein [Lyngbya sp. CCY1209]
MNKITHEGEIHLGNATIACYILEDGRRVLSSRGMQNALKMVDEEDGSRTPGSRLNRYLDQETLKPYLYKGKSEDHFKPIVCYKGKTKINGYEATVLIDLCDGFLEARKYIPLGPRQEIIASQCEILVRSFAKLGLIALIDEATGYQYDREKDALQKIIKAFVIEELRAWQKTFPDVYYREIFRLREWDFTVSGIKKRPGIVGKWTNQLIYEQLPEGVLEELKRKTPNNARLFQSLTPDVGEKALKSQLDAVITLMQASDTWEEFQVSFEKVVQRRKGQFELDFDDPSAG